MQMVDGRWWMDDFLMIFCPSSSAGYCANGAVVKYMRYRGYAEAASYITLWLKHRLLMPALSGWVNQASTPLHVE
jgi:hypothetical protein